MAFEENLSKLLARYDELQVPMASASGGQNFATVSKEFPDLGPVVEQVNRLRQSQNALADAEALAKDGDAEMRALAEEEIHRLKAEVREYDEAVRLALLPKDEADAKNAILEVRAGTGGEEAALF